MSALATALRQVAARGDLSRTEMAAVMREIMAGDVLPAQLGALLMGLASKGETSDEIVGAAEAMRESMTPVVSTRDTLLDTCGTGGSGVPRLNVSTAVAIAVAACGVAVAKHGNRAASSKSGSADVLAALGVNISASPSTVSRCIDSCGIGFLFASALHPAMTHAMPVRRALGLRTLFNLLGPLTNPAGANRQLLGVYDPTRCVPMAQALLALGSERVWVVHGFAEGVPAHSSSPWGIDDLSLAGETLVAQAYRGEVQSWVLTPEQAGLKRSPWSALRGGNPGHNAAAMRALFDGEPGPYRDAVVYSGAAALLVASSQPPEALAEFGNRIRAVLDDGSARAVLARLAETSQAA